MYIVAAVLLALYVHRGLNTRNWSLLPDYSGTQEYKEAQKRKRYQREIDERNAREQHEAEKAARAKGQ